MSLNASREQFPHIMCFIPDIEYQKIIGCYNYRWEEKYVYLIHSILFQSLRNKKEFSGYVNLDSSLLKKLIGSNYYKHILNQLKNSGIIQALTNKDGKELYSAGAFSKAYRINPAYTDGVRIKAIPIHKQTYCRKIALQREQSLRDALAINPNLQHEFLQMTRRRIDKERAELYVFQTYKENSPQYNQRMIAIREFDSMKDATFRQGSSKIGFHFSFNKGRVYSPASMLARDLEQFTYFPDYENEHSVSIDMPNSQLCFFHELIKRENKKVVHIGNEIYEEDIDGVIFPKSVPSLPLSCPSPYVFHFNTLWSDYIFNGLGYERMMFLTKWMDKDKGHTKDERQNFKAEFFGQLFYNKYSDALTSMEMVFMTYHEQEAKALREIKKKLGNKLLAVQVQTLEGKFFHDVIVHHLSSKYKDIPFTIKHDSITLPQSCASFLLDELNTLVREFFDRGDIELKADIL